MTASISTAMDSVIISYQVGAAAVLLFAILGEVILRLSEGKKPLPTDGVANISLLFFGPVMEAVFANTLLIAGLLYFYRIAPFHVPITGWTLIVYFIAG